MSFCHHLLFDRPSRCGHSLERDFLYFFGYGIKLEFPLFAFFST
uniref:Uncharacterized protein n=1 Tax=Rhizophora mucronata TaxID=61149 RepID=A0A2P2IIY5_RHIMU